MNTTRSLLFLLLLMRVPALGQETCSPTDTIGRHWQDLKEEASKSDVEPESEQTILGTELREGALKRLTGKATGLDELAAGSATEDFLPLLRFALVASGLQTGDSDLSLLSFERKIPTFGMDHWELKFEGKANDPEVFQPLKMKFGEDVRDDRVAELKEQFGELDDYSLGVSLNRKDETFGRSLDNTSRALLRALFDAAFVEIDLSDSQKANAEFNAVLGKYKLDAQTCINAIPEEDRPIVLDRLADAARAAGRTTEELRQALEAKGFFKLGDLLNNKPQIHGFATYRARKSFAGPDEISAKVTYEHDLSTNIKNLQEECGDKADSALVSCYETFISRPATEEDVEHGDRLTFSASYIETEPYRITLPEDEIDLDLDAGTTLSVSLKYGRFFDTGDLGPSARFDLAGTYEDISDDPNRQDRGIVSITFSNRFLRTLGLSLGLSYANHARFLPDTDEELSTHFGISYRMFPDEEEE